MELCPKSWDISGTKFRDPDPFQCPRRCGVPSRGPDHLWERVPRPQCVSFYLRVWNSVPGLGAFLGQSSESPIHFNVPECVGFYPGVQIIFWDRVPRPQCILMAWREWGSILGSGTLLGQSPMISIHFNRLEGVGPSPRPQNSFQTVYQGPNTLEWV